ACQPTPSGVFTRLDFDADPQSVGLRGKVKIEGKQVVPVVEFYDSTTATIVPRAIGIRVGLIGDPNGAAGVVGKKADPASCCCKRRIANLHLASVGSGEIDTFVELVTTGGGANPRSEGRVNPIQPVEAVGRP